MATRRYKGFNRWSGAAAGCFRPQWIHRHKLLDRSASGTRIHTANESNARSLTSLHQHQCDAPRVSHARGVCTRQAVNRTDMERNHEAGSGGSRRARVANFLSLERNVTIASAAILLIGFGEELWTKFLPKYLEALGATAPIVGLFGTGQDFFDAVYQYPGGWLSDRYGRRRASLIFIALASVGYFVYLFSPSWPVVFVGLALSLAWHSMASPAIFAVIGDSLPRERRAMGFTLQSILKRVPIVIAPMIGGALIASRGVLSGVHIGLVITLALAAVTALLVLGINIPVKRAEAINMRGVWQSFHAALKRLLISDL